MANSETDGQGTSHCFTAGFPNADGTPERAHGKLHPKCPCLMCYVSFLVFLFLLFLLALLLLFALFLALLFLLYLRYF